MSAYLEMTNDKIAENMDFQMKNEQDIDVLQEDIEMISGSTGNDANENDTSGHDSHSNEGDENGKETAMIVESLDNCKRYYIIQKLTIYSDTTDVFMKGYIYLALLYIKRHLI